MPQMLPSTAATLPTLPVIMTGGHLREGGLDWHLTGPSQGPLALPRTGRSAQSGSRSASRITSRGRYWSRTPQRSACVHLIRAGAERRQPPQRFTGARRPRRKLRRRRYAPHVAAWLGSATWTHDTQIMSLHMQHWRRGVGSAPRVVLQMLRQMAVMMTPFVWPRQTLHMVRRERLSERRNQ